MVHSIVEADLPLPTHTPSLEYWTGALLSAHLLGGDYARVLRRVEHDQELRLIASTIALVEQCVTPFLLDTLGLPRLETPSFWVSGVLPDIKKELERRSRPTRTWGTHSPI